MDKTDVLAILNDLPDTFKRTGASYAQLIDSYATGLSRFTQSLDSLVAQTTLSVAQRPWLDVWGLLFGIPRHTSESDADYYTRISGTLLTGAGPPLVIQNFLALSLGVNAVVKEYLPTSIGRSLELESSINSASASQLASDIARVRPAGIPYSFAFSTGGLYLSTVNYLGRASVSGSYLVESFSTVVPPIGPNTNNATSALPTLYLTDPNFN